MLDFNTESQITNNKQTTDPEKIRVETRVKTKDRVIALIKEDKTIATPELAVRLGISVKGVEYHLNRLKKDEIIKHVGPTKSGYWKILAKND